MFFIQLRRQYWEMSVAVFKQKLVTAQVQPQNRTGFGFTQGVPLSCLWHVISYRTVESFWRSFAIC